MMFNFFFFRYILISFYTVGISVFIMHFLFHIVSNIFTDLLFFL
jgi:hypothetical protein